MAWSWDNYKNTHGVPVTIHLQLQEDLKVFIANYIQEHVTGSKNIQFSRFWTETLNSNQVRASFEYSFDTTDATNETTNTMLKGIAYLSPHEDAEQTKEEWSLDRVEINNEVLEFKHGSLVTPGSPAPAAENKESK